MPRYDVPVSVKVKPLGASPFEAPIMGLVPNGVWIQTDQVLVFRSAVDLEFVGTAGSILEVKAEVVNVIPGGLGLELTAESHGAEAVLLEWSQGRAYERQSDPAPQAKALQKKVLEGLHTLVVEDDPSIAMLLETAIKKSGGAVTLARHGLAAIDAIDSKRIDAVLLDWMLPKMAGDKVLRSLRENSKKLPIAVISGVVTSTTMQTEVKRLGANAIFVKPFQVTAIIEWLKTALPKKS